MSNQHIDRPTNDTETTARIFADPIGYLASFGIEADVVAETVMPAAA